MERMNKRAEKFLKIIFKCKFYEVYKDGNHSDDFDLHEKYKRYTPEYIFMIDKGFVKHPIIPMPNEYGEDETDYSDSVVTPKGKAYLEELNRSTLDKNVKIIVGIITNIIAIAALIISIIALTK